jgi:excinuclease ABC subunit C
VLLRDDKSFPFILLREDHAFPRVQLHRGARRHKGQYYGPFASAGSVRTTLTALQKLFLIRSCTDSFFANRSRPCLLHQIRRCSAPCVGRVDPAGYKELIDDAKDFLGGKSTKVQQKLSGQMAEAAEAMDYELAAVYRDRLRALTFIQGSQAINAERVGDADIFGLACKGGTMCIQAFFIRGGQNWGARSFFPAHTNDVPEDEVLTSFLVQFYEEVPPPRLVLLDRPPMEEELLAEALAERAARKVELKVPQRGEQRRLVAQAKRNAEEGTRPPPRRNQHPDPQSARAGRAVRAPRAAEPHRGLRQQPRPGHQCGRRDDRRRPRRLPQEQLPQVQHQEPGHRARRRFRDDARGARPPLFPS